MNSKSSYSLETCNLGQIQRLFEMCDLEIWWMTLKNNRAPLLSNIKLCASFHHHMWIQNWSYSPEMAKLGFHLCDLDLWPLNLTFAVALLLSLAIIPENFMMIRWWEHSEKGVTDGGTDGQMDRQTDWTFHRAAWSQLKILIVWSYYLILWSYHWI